MLFWGDGICIGVVFYIADAYTFLDMVGCWCGFISSERLCWLHLLIPIVLCPLL
jgi:hypothetical protein